MTRIALSCLFAIALVAASDQQSGGPHPASVITAERTFANVFVVAETMDSVAFSTDSKSDNQVTQVNHGRYLRVDYAVPNEVPWFKGESLRQKGDNAGAAEQYLQLANSASWYSRHTGLMHAADCLLAAGKLDEAAQALDKDLAMFPKTVDQPRIAYLRAQILAKKNDVDGALKAFVALTGHNEWGNEAVALGALGQAGILAGQKKNADAANVLAGVFAKLDAGRDARFTEIGAELAVQQQAAGQNDAAIGTVRRMAYGGADGARRASAHLTWAQLLANGSDTKSLFAAFDHAVMATSIHEADAAVNAKATALVTALVQRIDKLPADQCSNEEKAEYRRYLTR